MSNEVIIDGVNVAECNRFCKTDNYNETNKCWSDISESYSDCKPKEYQCLFYVEQIEKQLQRLKAELKQYKQSKQASYEAMQNEWNNAVNENRLLRAALENKNFVAIAEENERLKAENEQLKNDIETGVMCVSCTKELLNCNLHKENEKLKSKIPWFEKWCLSNNECIKYKQALEGIRDITNGLKSTHCANCSQVLNNKGKCTADCMKDYKEKILTKINEVLNDV